jgi:hypothetical protein
MGGGVQSVEYALYDTYVKFKNKSSVMVYEKK